MSILVPDPKTGQQVLAKDTRRFLYMSVADTVEFLETRAPLPGNLQSSRDPASEFYDNMSYEVYMQRCKHGDFPDEISKIVELSEEIFKALPKGKSYRRVKEVGMTGSKVRATAVTGGNLSRAFVKTRREQQLGNLGVITLVFSCWYNCMHTKNHVTWKTATMLALALYIDQQGRQSEIWGAGVVRQLFRDGGKDGCMLVRAKASGTPFDLHELACLVSLCFLRRMLFGVAERLGKVEMGYGIAAEQGDFEAGTLALMQEHKIPTESVLFGPNGQDMKIDTIGAAVGWIVDTLKKVEVV